MTYSITKPDPGPSPKDDVGQIRTNFSEWASVFARNHTAMNNRFQGDHEGVVLEHRTGDPGVTNDFAVLFNKDGFAAVGTKPELFVQVPKFLPTKNDTVDAINGGMQLTYSTVNVAGPQYQSFMTGGILVYIGSITSVALPAIITLSPVPTKIYVAFANTSKMDVWHSHLNTGDVPFSVSTTILTASTFRIDSDISNPYTIQWLALAAV